MEEEKVEVRVRHKGARMEVEQVKHVDPLLLSVASGLGSLKEDEQGTQVYVADDDCLGCLKDLQRFLRKDSSDTRDFFFKLCEYDTARTDLLPILLNYPDNHDLVYNAIKVLTFLTMPILPTSARPSSQLTNLQHIKESVVSQPDVLAVICGEAAEALSRHPRMNEEQTATVQVCLSLLRNLLAIPDREGSGGGTAASTAPGGGAGLHSRFLRALIDADVLDLVTAVCKHAQERPFKSEITLLLDIVHEVVKSIDPQQVAVAVQPPPAPPRAATAVSASGGPHTAAAGQAAGRPQGANEQQGNKAHKPKDTKAAAQMKAILAAEKARSAALMRGGPRLHARDTGRYVRVHTEHNKNVFLTQGAQATELTTMQVPVPIRSGLDAEGSGVSSGSSLPDNVSWRLRGWMQEFLRSGAYNTLMEVARRDAEAGLGISRLEAPDLCRFMRLACVFLAFARAQHNQWLSTKPAAAAAPPAAEGSAAGDQGPAAAAAAAEQPSAFAGVSTSLGWSMFQLILTTWLGQVDIPGKSDLKQWEVQYCCVRVLRELLVVLEVAEASPNDHDSQAADRLQRRLLHDDMKESGLLPVLCKCARAFKPKQQAHSYAVDIIVGLATVVRVLDRLSAADVGGFMVKRKTQRAGGGRKAKAATPDAEAGQEAGQEPGGGAAGDQATSGGAGGVDDGENAQHEGQNKAEGGQQDGGAEGGKGGAGEEQSEGVGAAGGRGGGGVRRDPMELLEEDDSELDEEEQRQRVRDVQFDLNKRLMQELAQGAIVHFLVMQGMAYYQYHSREVNKAVAMLLWRIASPEGLNLEPLLYQLSILRVMHKLLADKIIRDKKRLPDYQDLLVLATRVSRGLFSKLCPPEPTEADVKDKIRVPEGMQGAAKPAEDEEQESDLEIEGDPEQEERRRAREEETKEREAARVQAVQEAVDKEKRVAGEMRDDYLLRVDVDDEPVRRPRQGRGVELGPEDEEVDGPMRAGGGMADWEEEGNEDAAPHAEAGDGTVAKPATRDLAAEHERRRKLHMAQLKASKQGGSGRGPLQQLAPEQQQQLVSEFQQLNAHRANMDLLLNRLGEDWTKDKIVRCLKALGYKFGVPTEEQLESLRSLWARHNRRDDTGNLQEVLLRIAAEMQGGWTSKQVRSLLKKQGLLENGRRSRHERVEVEASESDSGGEADRLLIDMYESELKSGYERHKAESREDMLQLVASELGSDVTPEIVRRALQKLGLIQKVKARSKVHKARGPRLMVDEDKLRELYEDNRNLADSLNRIAAGLGNGVTAKQVSKLLIKCNIVADEAAARKAAKAATERAQLVQLYQRHNDSSDYLTLMANDMPGVVTAQQVLKLMRKHGLLDAPTGAGTRRRQGSRESPEDADDEWGVGGAPLKANGRVPEPDADRALAVLAAMDNSEGCRWYRPAQAVSWIVTKLGTAAALQERARSASGAAMDYSLVMETEEDETFFMTDYAQDLLEAAGIRNDVGDFYKIPGNADAGWRERVKETLEHALELVDTEQATELASQFKDQVAEKEAVAKAKAAAVAARTAALGGAGGGAGGGKPAAGKGGKNGPQAGAGRGQSNKAKTQNKAAKQKLEIMAMSDPEDNEEEPTGRPRATVADSDSEGPGDQEPALPPARRPTGRMVAVDSSSDDGGDSSDESGGSSSSSGLSESEDSDRAPAQRRRGPVQKKPTQRRARNKSNARSTLPDFSSGSSGEEEGALSDGDPAAEGDDEDAGTTGKRKGVKKAKRTPSVEPDMRHAAMSQDSDPAAAQVSMQSPAPGDLTSPPSQKDSARAVRQPGTSKPSGKAQIEARKAALQALAAKRGGHASTLASPPAALQAKQDNGPMLPSASGAREQDQAAHGAGEAKRRRLLRHDEQENHPAAEADPGLDDLEDF